MGNPVSFTTTPSSDGTGDYRSLHRAVHLLSQFTRTQQELGASDLGRAAGLNKGTTHRLAQALVSLGLLEQDPGTRRYRLGVRLLEFGAIVQGGLDIRERAKPVLADLTAEFGETTYLLIYRDRRAVCVERIEGIHLLRDLSTEVGSALPMDVGAAPIAILAFLPEEDRRAFVAADVAAAERAALEAQLEEVRERGYSTVMGAIAEGHGGIAAPIFDREGVVCAAISIGGITQRLEENVATLGPAVVGAAEQISRRLGGPGESGPEANRT
jgi:DNA-binding IclR family transcriptional regulator